MSMSHDELKSAERKEEDKELQKENMRMAQAPQEEKSISSSLQCSKCKQYKVSYSQAQTRSADEPMTTFCECMSCGKRWKVSYSFFFFTVGSFFGLCLPVLFLCIMGVFGYN